MNKDHPFKTRLFHTNTAIFNRGDPAEAVYVVVSGAVAIRREIRNPGDPLATMQKGDVFGELALIEDRPHQAYAVTLRETTVVEIPRKVFLDQLNKLNPVLRAVIMQLVERLREATQEIEKARRDSNTGAG